MLQQEEHSVLIFLDVKQWGTNLLENLISSCISFFFKQTEACQKICTPYVFVFQSIFIYFTFSIIILSWPNGVYLTGCVGSTKTMSWASRIQLKRKSVIRYSRTWRIAKQKRKIPFTLFILYDVRAWRVLKCMRGDSDCMCQLRTVRAINHSWHIPESRICYTRKTNIKE